MNSTFTPSKLLISVIAVAAILGGCKKNDVTATPSDTAVTAPTTMAAPATPTTPANDGMNNGMNGGMNSGSDTTGASGTSGSTAAGMSNPNSTTVTGNGNSMAPGMNDTMNDSQHPAVRNNSGQTQGATPNANVPTSDGSR